MRMIHKIGKFYTRIIMKNIGIFIFIGLLSVLFHEHGWYPNKDIYAISEFAYQAILPLMVAFEGGQLVGGAGGSMLALLAVSGVLAADPAIGFFCGMLMGPFSGWVWRQEERWIQNRAGASVQMLIKNLCIGVSGGILALAGFYLVAPLLSGLGTIISHGAGFLVERRLLGLLNVLIEPAKVFFLNNLVDHSILVPLGIAQVQETGSSIFFLLETNPGPGLGLLCALYYVKKNQRSEYASALLAEAVGGIHEVYFPCVLSNLWLIFPLILGGMTGTFCFQFLGAGARATVSPGSFFTILLMAGKDGMLPTAAGVCASAVVTFICSLVVLRRKKRPEAPLCEKECVPEEEENMKLMEIKRIAFVCDGGMGSSAMGAALFRRMLSRVGIEGIQVEAFAADLVPQDVDLIVCQKDFYTMLPEDLKAKAAFTVDSLVRQEEYEGLVEQLAGKP